MRVCVYILYNIYIYVCKYVCMYIIVLIFTIYMFMIILLAYTHMLCMNPLFLSCFVLSFANTIKNEIRYERDFFNVVRHPYIYFILYSVHSYVQTCLGMPKAISNIQQYAKAKLLSYNVDFLRGKKKKSKEAN